MTKEELDEILQSYKWIKVNQYKHDEDRPLEENFERFRNHHLRETAFLIGKVRELAQQVYDLEHNPGSDDVPIWKKIGFQTKRPAPKDSDLGA